MSQRAAKADRPPHPLADKFAAAGLDIGDIDDFPTPPWAGRAWCEMIGRETLGRWPTFWEPTANRGYLVRGLADYGAVIGSDIFDYGAGFETMDFLAFSDKLLQAPKSAPTCDWIVTNAPYSHAERFILTALPLARVGCAFIFRTPILENPGRYERLYMPLGRRWMWSQFSERVGMMQAECRADCSTATAYGWLTIFREPRSADYIVDRRHIPVCRDRLEKKDDYR